MMLASLKIDDDRYLTLGDEVRKIEGVWDLPMIGRERLDIEREYQELTGGPNVNYPSLEGPIVVAPDGQMGQLQERPWPTNNEERLRCHDEDVAEWLSETHMEVATAASLMKSPEEKRKEHLERLGVTDAWQSYYPADGLPTDSVLVVRTEALRQFEANLSAPEPLAPVAEMAGRWPWGSHETELLQHLASAAQRWWANFDPTDNTTAPTNETVSEWLQERGVSKRTADTMATILRADDLPTGPRT